MDPTAGAPAESDGQAPPSGGKGKDEDAGKASQKEAQYGPAVSAARSCAMCANFDGQSKCAVVAGPVQPTGTSMMFTPKPEMAGINPAAISAAPQALPQGTKLGFAHEGLMLPVALGALGGTAIGGTVGGLRAPRGRKVEGVARGVLSGRMAGSLGTLGAIGGGLAAHDVAGRYGTDDNLPVVLAALGGGTLGAIGGHKLNRWVMGPASWEEKPKREKKSEVDELLDKLARAQKLKPWMPSKGRFRRKKAGAEKCACAGSVMCGPCAAKKKYKEVRPERREGAAKFAWRGRGAKSITDDPGYEKYTRKAAAAALDAVLGRG